MRAVTDAPREVTDDLENRVGCGNAHDAAALSETISEAAAHVEERAAATTVPNDREKAAQTAESWKNRGRPESRDRRDDDERTANNGDKGASPAGRGDV